MIPARMALSDPEAFASLFLFILDKNKQLTRLAYNRAQRNFMEQRSGHDLVLKARQLGFSTAIQGEMYRRAVTSTRTTMTMAHDDETTQKLRRMHDRFWENCKFGPLQPARKYSSATLITYPEFDSECIIATAGSKEAGRGGTYTDFHGSEVAFWNSAEQIIAGAMQGGNPDVVLESTPNGAQGWFYDRCMEALNGDSIWKLHFYPWWWDDGYRISLVDGEILTYTSEEADLARRHHLAPEQIKWRRSKQRELKRLFIQEYPEDPLSCFLTSGNSYFGNLEGVFTAPLDTEYQEGHRYYGGLDFGQANDYSSLTVIDRTAMEQVELLHLRQMSWSEIRRRIAARAAYWHLPYVLAEDNSIGSVNIEELQKLGIKVVPFQTTNASKAQIMSDYHEALNELGLKLLPIDIQRHEHRVFVARQLPSGVWQLAAEGNNHDDTVISGALAWWAANNYVPLPESQPEQKSKWKTEAVNAGESKWRKY